MSGEEVLGQLSLSVIIGLYDIWEIKVSHRGLCSAAAVLCLKTTSCWVVT